MAALLCLLLVGQSPQRPGPWELVRAEIQVRRAPVPGRYRVRAFLTFVPPPTAHPDLDPGPLTLWFRGDAHRQDLRFRVARLNGEEVDRQLVSLEPQGSRVLLAVRPSLRTVPWALELEVELGAEDGVVSLPLYAHQRRPAVCVVDPHGRRRRFRRLPAALRVVPRNPVPWVLGGAAGAAAVGLLWLWWRRRRRGAAPPPSQPPRRPVS